jgi:DNA-binding GntR family transcriptional regulator
MKNVVPEEVLKEIFQRKLGRRDLSGEVYNKLKKMILSGKFKKGNVWSRRNSLFISM